MVFHQINYLTYPPKMVKPKLKETILFGQRERQPEIFQFLKAKISFNITPKALLQAP